MVITQDLAHTTVKGIFLLAMKDIVSTVASIIFFVLVARFLPSIR